MARQMASVRKITEIHPIPNADRIEIAVIDGFDVVVQKGLYSVGDLCIYCETDSILPVDNPEFAFLEGKRIKIKRLRGIYSYGIAFPMSILGSDSDKYQENADLTEVLGIKKWEPDLEPQTTSSKKGFPSWIPKTDETRFQSVLETIKKHVGTECIVTEKVDGSSTTHFLDSYGNYHCCTRTREVDPDDEYYRRSVACDIPELLKELPEGAVVQGELLGPGIQKNKYNLQKHQIRMFNLRLNGKFVNEDDALDMLCSAGFLIVPVVNECWKLTDDKDALLNMGIGTSVINSKQQREGLVIRPKHDLYVKSDTRGQFVEGRFSFKIINPKFEMQLAKE